MLLQISMTLILAIAAQAGTGSVTGIVVDPRGGVVPGAEIFLKGIGHSFERSEITGLDGSFRFDQIPAGRFEIEVRLAQFKTFRKEIRVRNRALPPIRIPLELVNLKQEVVVSEEQARVSVNSGDNLDTVQLDRQFLDQLPSLGNDVLAAASIFLDPAMVGSTGPGLVVDGMETSRIGVSASAIREVRINRNPYTAEFFSPGRGRIEITTAREVSRFGGTLNFQLRDHRLDARNAFATERAPEQRRNIEGHLTGPVGRGRKNSFLLSAERRENDQWEQIYALTPSGLLQEQIPTPERDTEISFQFLRRPSDLSSFSLRFEQETDSVEGAGAGGFALPEVAAREKDKERAVHFSYRSVPARTWVHELQARLRKDEDTTRSVRTGTPKIVVLDAFTAGSGQEDTRSATVQMELSDVVSWSHGKHLVKMGANIRGLSRQEYEDRSERDGTFYFSSLEDYALRVPFSFVKQTGDGRVIFTRGEAGAFLQDDIRVRENLSIGVGLRYDGQSQLHDHNNFAPRLSLAFSPGRKRNTVIRAGGGVFYDRLGPGDVRDALLFDGLRLRQIVLPFPGYPDPFAGSGGIVEQPPSLVRFDPGLKAPYNLNYSVGLERQLRERVGLTLQYNGIRGIKLFRSRDLNTPISPQIERPDPNIGVLRQIESSSRLAAHSLEISVRGDLTRFYEGVIAYTLGRTYTDTGGIGSLPADSYDFSGEWGRASYDRTHRLRVYGTLRTGRLFSLGMMLGVESGAPYSLTTGRDDNRDGRATDRPPGVFRNTLQGTGGAVLDLRWSKRWILRARNGVRSERQPSATISFDAFNALNHVQYSNFVGNQSSPFFGRPVASRAARRIQIGLQFSF